MPKRRIWSFFLRQKKIFRCERLNYVHCVNNDKGTPIKRVTDIVCKDVNLYSIQRVRNYQLKSKVTFFSKIMNGQKYRGICAENVFSHRTRSVTLYLCCIFLKQNHFLFTQSFKGNIIQILKNNMNTCFHCNYVGGEKLIARFNGMVTLKIYAIIM